MFEYIRQLNHTMYKQAAAEKTGCTTMMAILKQAVTVQLPAHEH